jgi:hypothetical protein
MGKELRLETADLASEPAKERFLTWPPVQIRAPGVRHPSRLHAVPDYDLCALASRSPSNTEYPATGRHPLSISRASPQVRPLVRHIALGRSQTIVVTGQGKPERGFHSPSLLYS